MLLLDTRFLSVSFKIQAQAGLKPNKREKVLTNRIQKNRLVTVRTDQILNWQILFLV